MSKSNARVGRIAGRERHHGVTLDQAHEVFSRYFEQNQAVPTVAAEMGIEYKTACDVMDGKAWPQARQRWLDIVLP
jgi:hypothetical protein